MRAMAFVTCAVLATASRGTIATAAPADDKVKAKNLYEEGLRHYNLAEYAEAIRLWKEAYLLTKRPLLLFNIGQAYRLSGDCTQAMTFYESYTREQPNPKNQAEVVDAEALCRAKLAASPAAPTPVEPRRTPTQPLFPAAADPAISGSSATAPARTDTARSGGKRTAGIIVGATGVVLEGVAIYFALDARKQAKKLDGYQGEWGDAQRDTEARGQRDQKLAWGFGLVGAGAIGVGIALYVLGGASSETTGVAIAPTATGGEISWTLRY
ncbi:MAG: hypothetical protein H0T89_12625 [Deltaproteobacteria bacterium]|nr:hypothetical protein [Deltaproteobacteria bacterium]MDQ3295576.1 hypothetical protein [Myxococcota bacterium]